MQQYLVPASWGGAADETDIGLRSKHVPASCGQIMYAASAVARIAREEVEEKVR